MAYVYLPGGITSGTQDSNYQGAGYLLRTQYMEGYVATIAAACPAYAYLKSDVETFAAGGLDFRFNILSRISGAAGWGGRMGVLAGSQYGLVPNPTARQAGAAQGTATYKYYSMSAAVSDQDIKLFGKNPNGSIDLQAMIDTDLLTTMGKQRERNLFSHFQTTINHDTAHGGAAVTGIDHTGILAQLTTAVPAGAAGAAISIPISLGNGHPRQFFRGMQLVWGTYDDLIGSTEKPNQQGQLSEYSISSAGNVTLTVLPNDSSATLIVTDPAVAGATYLCCGDGNQNVTFAWGTNSKNPFNSLTNEPFGFRAMARDSGTLFGIDPTVAQTNNWKGVVDNGGLSGTATRQFNFLTWQRFCLKYAQLNAKGAQGSYGPGEMGADVQPPKIAFVSDYLLPTIQAAVPGVAMLDPNAPEASIGEDTPGSTVQGVKIKFCVSPRCPVDEIIVADFAKVKRPEMQELAPLKPYGGPWTPNAVGFATSLLRTFTGADAQVCVDRQGMGAMTNFAVQSWPSAALND